MLTKEERDEIYRRALAACRPKAWPPKPTPTAIAEQRWAQKSTEVVIRDAAAQNEAVCTRLQAERAAVEAEQKRARYQAVIDRYWQSMLDAQTEVLAYNQDTGFKERVRPSCHRGPGDCVLFIADEAYWGGDKRCVGRLQAMITEPKLTIERKGIDAFEVRNLLHIVMLAEPGWVIPAGRYERRYAAFAVNTAMRGNRAYFRALHDQIHNGGAEAMFHELQRMDLGDWHPREVPNELLTNSAL